MSKISLLLLFSGFLLGAETARNDLGTEFIPQDELRTNPIPEKENVWVFVLAGQSNMAGRGLVEPIDTIPNPRIFSINANGDIVVAKEPLHFYEPALVGLDCGLSFGKELLKHIPDSTSILLIPTAVGGSSVAQWINDSTYRNVPLLSNFKGKIQIAKAHGIIKGILWHQGETDAAKPENIEIHDDQLKRLFTLFRNETDNKTLPILIGELGSFSKTNDSWQAINSKIAAYAETDPFAYVIKTSDLQHKGDFIHFDSDGQREMGKRFAWKFAQIEE